MHAAAVYDHLDMHPLVIRNEIPGYLSDRLQEALWREILHLVNDGTASTGELDDAIILRTGPAVGRDGDQPHLPSGRRPAEGCATCSSSSALPSNSPGPGSEAPELSDSLIEAMVDGTAEQAAGRSVVDLERLRDDYLVAVYEGPPLGRVWVRGIILARREARRYGQSAQPQWSEGDEVPAPAGVVPLRRRTRLGRLQQPHDRGGVPDRLRVGL